MADSLRCGDELTVLASRLDDCLSGLEDVGRDGVFSSYSLLLKETETEREV